jgi:hypothetical protein
VYRIFVGKPEIKRPLRSFRHWWENNIKMDLTEMRWGCMDCIDLAEDRDQWRGPYEHGNEPSVSLKCWEIFK